VRLTDAAIKALKPRENVYDVYDDDVKCFGVRVTPAGVKSFTFFYRLGDRRKKKRINLGEYPHVTLADARQTAREARGVVKGERRHPEINKAPAQQSAEPLTIEPPPISTSPVTSSRPDARRLGISFAGSSTVRSSRLSLHGRSSRSRPPTSSTGPRGSSTAALPSPRTSRSRS